MAARRDAGYPGGGGRPGSRDQRAAGCAAAGAGTGRADLSPDHAGCFHEPSDAGRAGEDRAGIDRRPVGDGAGAPASGQPARDHSPTHHGQLRGPRPARPRVRVGAAARAGIGRTAGRVGQG